MSIKERAIETLDIEGKAVLALKDRIGDEFVAAVNCILKCPARVVVTGMGKSGHVGRKIAATLASTGTPSFFLHPAEAFHGDLGMVTENDVVIASCASQTASTRLSSARSCAIMIRGTRTRISSTSRPA